MLERRLEQAQAEALLDPLCGLKNCRGFEWSVTEVFASRSDARVALLIADVDHFKRVNDTYGRLLGDTVLRAIARTVQTKLEGGHVAARYGGDELTVLLPQTGVEAAEALAEQIRAAVANGRIQRSDGQFLRVGITHHRRIRSLDGSSRRGSLSSQARWRKSSSSCQRVTRCDAAQK